MLKTILIDAYKTFVIPDEGINLNLYNLFEKYPNKKIILTNANDDEIKKLGLTDMPYEMFTLKHNPNKVDPIYFKEMLRNYNLEFDQCIYFEHDKEAVKSAESVGIKSYFYDENKQDLKSLKKFLDSNL